MVELTEEKSRTTDLHYLLKRATQPSRASHHASYHHLAPLMLFLHGAGESGHHLKQLLSEGATGTPPMLAFREAPQLARYVLAAPQTSGGWSGRTIRQQVVALVDELVANPALSIDPSRVYLTGVSMGGAGVWSIAAHAPQIFAAIVPICAAAQHVSAGALERTPAFVWHGANDVIVPVAFSDQSVAALEAVGNPHVRYSRLDHAPAPIGWPHYDGHASWIPAFSESSPLWDWLSEQRRTRA